MSRGAKHHLLIITILFIVIFAFETYGYATYTELLTLNGVSTFIPEGVLEINDVILVNTTNATENTPVSYNKIDINFDLSYQVSELSDDYDAKYKVFVTNGTSYDYTFVGDNLNSTISVTDGTTVDVVLDGITYGEVIPARTSVEFYVTIVLHPATEYTDYDVNGSFEPDVDSEPIGQILVGLDKNNRTGDLRNAGAIAQFTYDVNNTLEYEDTVSLSINSNLFELCDSIGNTLNSVTVSNDGITHTYDFYVKAKTDAIFARETEYLYVYSTTSTSSNVSLGRLTLYVTATPIQTDFDAPVISGVTGSQNSTVNSAHVVWNSSDDSGVDYYTVIAYNSSNTEVNRKNTDGDVLYIDIPISNDTSNADGNYYFKVYGIDTYGNTATTSEINNATTSSGHCSKSSNVNLDWYASVSYTGDLSGSVTEILKGTELNVTLTATNTRTPTINSVKMGGTTLTSGRNGYTGSTNGTNRTATIKITNVTGDVVIDVDNGTGGCLIEGTLIETKVGYKKIEDITYYDLLKVWDYDNGTYTYEYPIWIEKEHTTSSYQVNAFSDGTTLKTVGYHGVYNLDLNKFVSVDNPHEFYVGSSILKLENGKFKKVKVTSIKQINDSVKYYHVVSTRYYNIIANNVLTTDGTTILSNLYGFDNNLKWINRNNIKYYNYDDFKDITPYYMYYGLRMMEAKNLSISLDEFKYYLINNQLDSNMLLNYPQKNNKNKYIVSTNTGINKYVLEGETFTLPTGIWLCTTDNKLYSGTINIYNSNYYIKVE